MTTDEIKKRIEATGAEPTPKLLQTIAEILNEEEAKTSDNPKDYPWFLLHKLLFNAAFTWVEEKREPLRETSLLDFLLWVEDHGDKILRERGAYGSGNKAAIKHVTGQEVHRLEDHTNIKLRSRRPGGWSTPLYKRREWEKPTEIKINGPQEE